MISKDIMKHVAQRWRSTRYRREDNVIREIKEVLELNGEKIESKRIEFDKYVADDSDIEEDREFIGFDIVDDNN
jgi:hypothetical protein